MQDATLKSKLVALREGTTVSAMRRIARVLPEIEAALLYGVSREAILKTLQDDGIEITAASFSTVLYRLRKQARATESSPANSPRQETSTGTRPATEARRAAPSPAPHKTPFSPTEIRDLARNRPDLNELTRLGRQAAAKAKAKPDTSS
jgi:hypothetical protein